MASYSPDRNRTFTAKFYNGRPETTRIYASGFQEALHLGIEWAKSIGVAKGDSILITRDDSPNDGLIPESIEIEDYADCEDDDGGETCETIGSYRGELCTLEITLLGSEACLVSKNGGEKGAHDRGNKEGEWIEKPCQPCERLTRTQARRLMLDWGFPPQVVLEKTARIDPAI